MQKKLKKSVITMCAILFGTVLHAKAEIISLELHIHCFKEEPKNYTVCKVEVDDELPLYQQLRDFNKNNFFFARNGMKLCLQIPPKWIEGINENNVIDVFKKGGFYKHSIGTQTEKSLLRSNRNGTDGKIIFDDKLGISNIKSKNDIKSYANRLEIKRMQDAHFNNVMLKTKSENRTLNRMLNYSKNGENKAKEKTNPTVYPKETTSTDNKKLNTSSQSNEISSTALPTLW